MATMSHKMRFLTAAAAVAICGYSFGAHAELVGDAKAGEEKAGLCGGCHGPDGNSEDANIPRLAGQYAGYIVKQVKDFKATRRVNNDTMAKMAASVATDQDAWDIAAYFAQQQMKGVLTPSNQELVAAGEKIFRNGNSDNGVFPCISCHGESGKGKSGNNSVFPVLGGQHRDYLVKQLNDFRTGARNNDPAGMMNMVATKLTDKEIEAIAEYLATKL